MAVAVSGCSNHEDDFLEIVKCNLSAQRLSQSQALYEIDAYAHKFSESSGYTPKPDDWVKIGLRGRDELKLEKLDSQETHKVMLDIYNSSTCKKMHKQPELES